MEEKLLNYEFFDKCTSLSDAARKLFGRDNYRDGEKIKIISEKYGFDWRIWGERRKKKTKTISCLNCGKEIEVSIRQKKEKKFCSQTCSAEYNNKNRHLKKRIKNDVCIKCGKKITNKWKYGKYCSKECEKQAKQEEYIKRWKNNEENGTTGRYGISLRIKKYLFDKYNNQCQLCGWNKVNPITGNIPLQIHHIDGNCTNNKEENLQLLCPNCHSLTETFGNLNKNSQRIFRRQKENI